MGIKFPEIEEKGSSKTFLKIGEGNSIVGVFRGDPEIYYQIFENGKYKVVSKETPGSQFKFAINFVMKENGALVSKIFQGNWHDLKALKALHEEFNLEETYVKVSQSGERQNKRLSFMPMTKQKPDQASIRSVDLQDAKPRSQQAANVGYGDVSGYSETKVTLFDEETVPF